MKYCPQCNRRFSEVWLTFCTDDGSLLREELSPPADPNWDPRIRERKFDDPSEHPTQWLPRDPPPASGWMAPDERAPIARPWQPPPPPPQPPSRPAPPGLAVASFAIGIVGIVIGLVCAVPIPGILAVILGIVALVQMRSAPNSTGRGLAVAGIVMGSINLAFLLFWFLWMLLSLGLG
jgi:hypothetical protein